MEASLPFDPNVRTGKLDNGMVYYIRKNAKPENRIELRLAVNAGSMQEEDDQQGLAHFVDSQTLLVPAQNLLLSNSISSSETTSMF